MTEAILRYGTIAGLIVGVPLAFVTIFTHGHADSPWGLVFGYLIMLVALSAVFVAIKRRRDQDLGGVIRFWAPFALGLGIGFVGTFYPCNAPSAGSCAQLSADIGIAR